VFLRCEQGLKIVYCSIINRNPDDRNEVVIPEELTFVLFMCTESCTDVLPRLFKIKYDSGLLNELLFLDLAEEYVHHFLPICLGFVNANHFL